MSTENNNHNTNPIFYYYKDNNVIGPCSFDEIAVLSKAGLITLDMQIWHEFDGQWHIASDACAIEYYWIERQNSLIRTAIKKRHLEFKPDTQKCLDNDLHIPPNGVAIRFRQTRFQAVNEAIEKIKLSHNYSCANINKKIWHQGVFNSIVDAAYLLQLISTKFRHIFINGIEVDWGIAWRIAYCIISRKDKSLSEYCYQADDESGYCKYPWGCKCLNPTDYYYPDNWYMFGEWDIESTERNKMPTYKFDKERIKQSINTSIKDNVLCPFFNINNLDLFINLLPETAIAPSDDWKLYHEIIQNNKEDIATYDDDIEFEEDNSNMNYNNQTIIVHIQEADRFGNDYIKSIRAKGVIPVDGNNIFNDIRNTIIQLNNDNTH